jgi:hypothetical protein
VADTGKTINPRYLNVYFFGTVVGGLLDGRPRTSQLDKAFRAEGRLLLVGPLRGRLSAERR